jgi:hypothetical protein
VLNVTPSDLKNCPVDMLSAHPLLREKTDFVRPINVICPVQICLKEYSASRSAQITGVSIASRPTEGRFAIVTNVGQGMRWTRQRRRDT